MKNRCNSSPRIVLIDDDPVFASMVEQTARKSGIAVDTYGSLEEMGAVGCLGKYNVVIADYHLDQMNGIEIGQYLDAFFDDIPMVLISSSDQRDVTRDQPWPKSIKGFVSKHEGLGKVLEAASSACGNAA